ncbi:MAG: copper resistance protein CopC [Dietzia sp.]|uniref:copper resistance CopC family protein n=1 Tax=Dietzia sp. TaxID=1871616 RepID=UPI0027286C3B|nr:copper resistance CopC family protein [Dietzia sp.]MDO8393522.1 copper resistance protein CopC [Dietzia sp.]
MTPIRARLASTALAATMIVGAAAPATVLAPVAAAHSVLVSVDPQDGATLETSPGEVSLTFNEEINQNFASVAVTTGDDRTTLVVGEPTVEGETVTVALDDLADGAYTVGYRVTSADGHVVSGSSVFTVRSAAAGSGEATATPGATGDPAGEQSDPAENQVADETSGEASSGVDPALWVVGGLAVLLIGGAFVLLRRGN